MPHSTGQNAPHGPTAQVHRLEVAQEPSVEPRVVGFLRRERRAGGHRHAGAAVPAGARHQILIARPHLLHEQAGAVDLIVMREHRGVAMGPDPIIRRRRLIGLALNCAPLMRPAMPLSSAYACTARVSFRS